MLAWKRRERRRAHLQAAQLAAFINANRDPKKTAPVSPDAFLPEDPDAVEPDADEIADRLQRFADAYRGA